jgi:hypothetical protein
MAFLRKLGSGLAEAARIYGEGPGGLLQRRRLAHEREDREIPIAEYLAKHPEDFDTVSKLAGPLKLDLEKYRPTEDTLLSGERAKIEKDPYTTTPPQIMRDLKATGVDTTPVMGQTGRFAAESGGESGGEETLPSTQYGPTNRPPIQDLLNQRQENISSHDADIKRKLGIEEQTSQAQAHGQATGHAQGVHEAAPTALQDELTQRAAIDPLDVAKAGASQQAQFDSVNDIDRQHVAARGAGLKTGAEAAARFPYEKKLAETRLDNQQKLLDYRNAHPSLSPQARDRATMAVDALDRVDTVRSLAQNIDKLGMMGPIAGILRDAQGKPEVAQRLIGAVWNDRPEEQRIAGEFISSLGTLQTLIGMVHGGVRGGGSPQLLKHMQSIMNGSTDLPFFEGELDGIESLMNVYAKYPERYFSGHPFDRPAKDNTDPAGPQLNTVDSILSRPPRKD